MLHDTGDSHLTATITIIVYTTVAEPYDDSN